MTETEKRRREFVASWTGGKDFGVLYDGKSPAEYVDALFANARLKPDASARAALAGRLGNGELTRAQVLQSIAGDDTLYLKEFSRAFVLMHFFYYLRRNPDDPPDTGPGGLDYWAAYLDRTGDFCSMEGLFRGSREFQSLPGN
ncbi:MAG: hypothetical protein H0T60_06700 [Acidobacteria bacterium]|nr:hypothetical protein [Acidobacteriota bacterium]